MIQGGTFLLRQLVHFLVGIYTEINNTVLIHDFIIDLCKLSNPDDGIRFSNEYLELMKAIKNFNYENIYFHPKLVRYQKYADLILSSIFEILAGYYAGADTLEKIKKDKDFHPVLTANFKGWLLKHSNINPTRINDKKYKNRIIYNIENIKDYHQSIIDFISGMTDQFAIKIFNEITSF